MPIPATTGAFAIVPCNDLAGPDGLPVRIGWPSRLMQGAPS